MTVIDFCMKTFQRLPLPRGRSTNSLAWPWRCFAAWSGAICRPNTHCSSTHNLSSRHQQFTGILHPLLGCFVCILHFCTSFEPVYQCFGDLMPTADSLEKSLMLGKIEGRGEEHVRGWDGWMASLMQWTRTWGIFRRWWGTGRPGALQ